MRLPEFRRNGTPQPRQTAAHATLVWLSHQFGRHGVCACVCVCTGVFRCMDATMQAVLAPECQAQADRYAQKWLNGFMIVTIALQEMSPCT